MTSGHAHALRRSGLLGGLLLSVVLAHPSVVSAADLYPDAVGDATGDGADIAALSATLEDGNAVLTLEIADVATWPNPNAVVHLDLFPVNACGDFGSGHTVFIAQGRAELIGRFPTHLLYDMDGPRVTVTVPLSFFKGHPTTLAARVSASTQGPYRAIDSLPDGAGCLVLGGSVPDTALSPGLASGPAALAGLAVALVALLLAGVRSRQARW